MTMERFNKIDIEAVNERKEINKRSPLSTAAPLVFYAILTIFCAAFLVHSYSAIAIDIEWFRITAPIVFAVTTGMCFGYLRIRPQDREETKFGIVFIIGIPTMIAVFMGEIEISNPSPDASKFVAAAAVALAGPILYALIMAIGIVVALRQRTASDTRHDGADAAWRKKYFDIVMGDGLDG